jgi:Na+/melibiose symporter-like transporter
MSSRTTLGLREGLSYGLLGLPLAFVALPLYVLLPHHYAQAYGVPLAALGAVLLATRLADAFIDPLIGRLSDWLYQRSLMSVWTAAIVAAIVLALGFGSLFFPPTGSPTTLLGWAAGWLLLTYAAYSLLTVTHQAWGAMLGGDEATRARIVGWREGLGLVGVVLASVLPTWLGLSTTTAVLALALGLACWTWTLAPQPGARAVRAVTASSDLWGPWRNAAFRRLITVFMLCGIANAVPATLVLFFVQDRLRAPESWQPVFLGTYFIAAAASIPLWLRLVQRIGLASSWRIGMAASVVVFAGAFTLGAGDTLAFLVVCVCSGLMLGSDLALPSALLAGVIADAGDRGRAEGAYFGWWNFATKLNLALAAGLSLPLLALLGYTPGTTDPRALAPLSVAYCLVPCALKALAAWLHWRLHSHPLISSKEVA